MPNTAEELSFLSIPLNTYFLILFVIIVPWPRFQVRFVLIEVDFRVSLYEFSIHSKMSLGWLFDDYYNCLSNELLRRLNYNYFIIVLILAFIIFCVNSCWVYSNGCVEVTHRHSHCKKGSNNKYNLPRVRLLGYFNLRLTKCSQEASLKLPVISLLPSPNILYLNARREIKRMIFSQRQRG